MTTFSKFALSFWTPWANLLEYIANTTRLTSYGLTPDLFFYELDMSANSGTTITYLRLECLTPTKFLDFTYYDGTNVNEMAAAITASSINAAYPQHQQNPPLAHVMIGVDGSQSPPTLVVYVNDTQLWNGALTQVSGSAETFSSIANMVWPHQNTPNPALTMFDGMQISIGEFWYNNEYLDWTSQANRDLFQNVVNGVYSPANLGTFGEVPLQANPTIYIQGGSSFPFNLAAATEITCNGNSLLQVPLTFDVRSLNASAYTITQSITL